MSIRSRKISAFFDENWPKKNYHSKKNWQKISQHAAKLKGAPSINAKTLAFPSFLYRQGSEIYPLPFKNPKIEFLSLITRQKIRRPKIWNMIDREPVVVFIQKSDKSDQ